MDFQYSTIDGTSMPLNNKFSNIKSKVFSYCFRRRGCVAAAGIEMQGAEQAYLGAASDHQDLERRLKVLECRHGSILHTLRVMKTCPY